MLEPISSVENATQIDPSVARQSERAWDDELRIGITRYRDVGDV